MRVALEVLAVPAVLAVERPTALVERVLVLLVLLAVLVLLVLLVLLVRLVLLDVLVVLPNVLRAVAGVAVRAEVRAPAVGVATRSLVRAPGRIVVVPRISRALVIPLLRRAKERSGCAVAYSQRPTFRCKS